MSIAMPLPLKLTLQAPNCPDEPDLNYPRTHLLKDLTQNWNTDVTDIPPNHYDELCHFDFQNPSENKKAWSYRNAERFQMQLACDCYFDHPQYFFDDTTFVVVGRGL